MALPLKCLIVYCYSTTRPVLEIYISIHFLRVLKSRLHDPQMPYTWWALALPSSSTRSTSHSPPATSATYSAVQGIIAVWHNGSRPLIAGSEPYIFAGTMYGASVSRTMRGAAGDCANMRRTMFDVFSLDENVITPGGEDHQSAASELF